jgi:hypothetical protein
MKYQWKKLTADPAPFLAFLLVAFCVIKAMSYGMSMPGIDFEEKWAVGRMIEGGAAERIYLGGRSEHISTPFLYALYAKLSSANFVHDVRFYRFFSLFAFIMGIVGLSRMLGYSATAAMVAIAFLTGFFEPFFSDVRVANINQIQLGMVTLFLWLMRKRSWRIHTVLAGFVLGITVVAKPNLLFVPLLLGLSWLINRRIRTLVEVSVGLALAGAFGFAISLSAFDSAGCWVEWLNVLRVADDYRFSVDAANYSAAMLIYEWLGIKVAPLLAAGLTAIVAGCLWAGRNKAEDGELGSAPHGGNREKDLFDDMLAVAAGCLIYLLSMSLVWLHYFVLAVPMALIALRPSSAFRSSDGVEQGLHRLLGAIALAAIAELPREMNFPFSGPHHMAVIDVVAALTLLGIGLREMVRLRKEPATSLRSGMNSTKAARD